MGRWNRMMREKFADILGKIPKLPGIYIMKDGKGNSLYIGKAKSLKARVRSYFQPSASHPVHIATMVRQVRDI